jgi:hypothetical protein
MYKVLLTLLVPMLLVSCISYHRDGSDEYERPIELERGVTTEALVYENLGTPRSRHIKENGVKILHYTFDRNEETKVNILLIINVHNKDKSTSHLYIEIDNGIVTDFWDD